MIDSKIDSLATHEIGEEYPECKQGSIDNFRIVDVRTLVDGEIPCLNIN